MRKTILLTGGTGALGSMLLPRLLAVGYQVVCLVRQRGSESPRDRIRKLVGDHPRVMAVRGDICESHCGISFDDFQQLCGEVSFVLHCAASISFSSEQETQAANVEGLRNTLALADALEIKDFRHVSTTYVAEIGRAHV